MSRFPRDTVRDKWQRIRYRFPALILDERGDFYQEESNMELAQIRYFLTLCRTKNFSRAAEELYVAQPTLSQQIKRLEEELGVSLFIRSTRSVQLTEAGQVCEIYARRIMENLDQLTAAAAEYHRKIAGSLSVGVLAVLPHLDVSGALAAFHRQYAEVSTTLQFDWSLELLQLLNQRKLDVVISNIAYEQEIQMYNELDFHVFLEDSLYVVLNKDHPLARQRQIEVEQIADETFWVCDSRSSVKRSLEVMARERGLPPLKFCETTSMTNTFKMVESGAGVSVMSHNVAKQYQRAGTCCRPLLPKTKTQTAIITRRDCHPLDAAKCFETFFLSYIHDDQPETH